MASMDIQTTIDTLLNSLDSEIVEPGLAGPRNAVEALAARLWTLPPNEFAVLDAAVDGVAWPSGDAAEHLAERILRR